MRPRPNELHCYTPTATTVPYKHARPRPPSVIGVLLWTSNRASLLIRAMRARTDFSTSNSKRAGAPSWQVHAFPKRLRHRHRGHPVTRDCDSDDAFTAAEIDNPSAAAVALAPRDARRLCDCPPGRTREFRVNGIIMRRLLVSSERRPESRPRLCTRPRNLTDLFLDAGVPSLR